jgi:hypothetical protein
MSCCGLILEAIVCVIGERNMTIEKMLGSMQKAAVKNSKLIKQQNETK